MDITKKINRILGESEFGKIGIRRNISENSFDSAEKIELGMDVVKQKISAEKNPKEKVRLQARLQELQQKWIEAMRAGRDEVNSGKK